MIVVGIDIGLDGALCAMDQGRTPLVLDLPAVKVSETRAIKRRIDARQLLTILRPFAGRAVFAIEDIHAMPNRPSGDGAAVTGGAGNASIMESLAIVRTVIEIIGCDYYVVPPKAWQRAFGLKADKGEHLECARRIRPDIAEFYLARKKDHNRADAVLLARYAQMVHAGQVATAGASGVKFVRAEGVPLV